MYRVGESNEMGMAQISLFFKLEEFSVYAQLN